MNFHGKEALRRVMHNDTNDPSYQGLPKDEKLLYQFFDSKRKKLNQLRKANILKQDQYDLLLPPGKQETCSNKFDITLLVLVIRNFVLHLQPPKGGWNIKKPQPGDFSLAAFVVWIRELRNQILHGAPDDFLDPQHFQIIWSEIRRALLGVQYNCIGDFDNILVDKVVIDLNDGKDFIENLVKDLRKDLNHEITKQSQKVLQNVLDQLEKKIQELKKTKVINIVEPEIFKLVLFLMVNICCPISF